MLIDNNPQPDAYPGASSMRVTLPEPVKRVGMQIRSGIPFDPAVGGENVAIYIRVCDDSGSLLLSYIPEITHTPCCYGNPPSFIGFEASSKKYFIKSFDIILAGNPPYSQFKSDTPYFSIDNLTWQLK